MALLAYQDRRIWEKLVTAFGNKERKIPLMVHRTLLFSSVGIIM